MKEKNRDRFNAELLRSHLETANMSQRELARLTGVRLGTVQNWLRGGLPGADNLRKLGDVFDVDPHDFLADPFDMLFSEGMTLAFTIFLKHSKGDLEIKVTLSGLVRLMTALGVFEKPPEQDLDLPESALQALLPQLEAKAKADAEKHVLALADLAAMLNLQSRRWPDNYLLN